MKIAIIGDGLFGITTFLKLKSSGYDCILIEKEKKLFSYRFRESRSFCRYS